MDLLPHSQVKNFVMMAYSPFDQAKFLKIKIF